MKFREIFQGTVTEFQKYIKDVKVKVVPEYVLADGSQQLMVQLDSVSFYGTGDITVMNTKAHLDKYNNENNC